MIPLRPSYCSCAESDLRGERYVITDTDFERAILNSCEVRPVELVPQEASSVLILAMIGPFS